jgi:YggT family protein
MYAAEFNKEAPIKMVALISVINLLLNIATFLLLAHVIIDYLVRFGVTSYRNGFVAQLKAFTSALFEPVLGPLRRALPSFNGVDLSPLVLFIVLYFLRVLLAQDLMPLLTGRV